MSMPKLFGASPSLVKGAEAQNSPKLQVPEEGTWPVTKSKDSKGEWYIRWAEVGTVQKAYVEASKNGFTTFVIQVKIRTGMPNQNKNAWGRHYMDVDAYESGNTAKEGMNNRTIAALSSLLKATNNSSADGGINKDVLAALFPVKDGNKVSPLVGKIITANLCESPNQGGEDPRRTQIDSYNTGPA